METKFFTPNTATASKSGMNTIAMDMKFIPKTAKVLRAGLNTTAMEIKFIPKKIMVLNYGMNILSGKMVIKKAALSTST